MTRLLLGVLFLVTTFTGTASLAIADDTKDEAIRKDRNQIEGRWRIISLVVNGNQTPAENTAKLTVMNEDNGTWTLRSEGKIVSKGTSSIDPTQQPKTIDFTVTEGGEKGNRYTGIYRLGERTRQMCFAPPSAQRPQDFTAPAGSHHICVKYQRESPEATSRSGGDDR